MDGSIFTRDAAERAVRTFIQFFITAVAGLNITDQVSDGVDLNGLSQIGLALAGAAIGALLSTLTSLVAREHGDADTASFVDTTHRGE